jgi:tryptophan 7-halogenase
VQVPYETEDSPIVSHTVSTAQAHGWIWDIGLKTRRGVGYVYSSRHAEGGPDASQVEAALAAYVGPGFDKLSPREISIRPGHREVFWKNNCVAVGLAAGFLEPLEASALVLIELSADYIATAMPATRSGMDIVARRFNEMTRYRWDRIIEFLKLHYVLSEREDTAFWRDNRDPATIPQPLQDQLELWRYTPPGEHDFASAHEMFPAASYQYVLYGMGFRLDPQAQARALRDPDVAQDAFERNAMIKRQLATALPTNRGLLNKLADYRFQAI